MATNMEQHMPTPMSTCDICDDEMSTDNGERVWVGFIDDLPVIGSVKEAVEFVLAVASGDSLLAKEKERMMKVRLGLEEKTHLGRSTASSSGDCSGEQREAVHVKDVLLSDLPGVIQAGNQGKGKQSGKQSQKPPSAEDKNKIETIRRETLRKIQLIDENFRFQEPLVDTAIRSKKGEHVINKDVIKFHFKLVKDYLKGRSGQNSLHVSCPLTDDTKHAIMYEMVAHFEAHELYINANEQVYGQYINHLKNALLEFLQDGSQGRIKRANSLIRKMNKCDAYVDVMAKEKWMQDNPKDRYKFEPARKEVADMFANRRGTEFFEELRRDILSHTGHVSGDLVSGCTATAS